jgi:PAS domain S-box-containing protein
MRKRLRGLAEVLANLDEAESTLAQLAGALLARHSEAQVEVPGPDGEQVSRAAQEPADAVLILDRDGYIMGATVHAAKLFGYEAAALCGRHMKDLLAGEQSARQPPLSQYDCAAPWPANANELDCQHADGRAFRVAARVAQLNPDGDPKFALIISGDRPQRGADQSVRLAMARYQALVEQIPAVTFMASLDGTRNDLYVSPQIETLLGFKQREWLDDPILWFRQLHPDDLEVLHGEFARGIRTGGPFRAEVRVFTRHGKTVWVRGEARLIKDAAGRPLFFQGVAFDITEAKRAEHQLREAHEGKLRTERLAAIGQLAASVSHDLRNPLGSIRNAWYYIRRKIEASQVFSEDPRLKRFSNLIESELTRCANIVGDLLDFTRDPPLRRVQCQVEALVNEALSAVVPPSAAIKITREFPHDPPKPYLDISRFRQVLINLFQNAVDAVDPVRGAITTRVARDGDQLVIEIQDNGKGIGPDIKERIFEPLFTTKVKGTGLGLCIVANLVRSHSGTISVDSTVGRGTTFRIRIPIEEDGSRAARD